MRAQLLRFDYLVADAHTQLGWRGKSKPEGHSTFELVVAAVVASY